jgi:hypothetical protein
MTAPWLSHPPIGERRPMLNIRISGTLRQRNACVFRKARVESYRRAKSESMTRSAQQLALAVLTAAATAVVSNRAQAAEKLQYNRDIRPILVENCFTCHGADSAARKAGLRLDKRDDAIQHGAVVPGKPDESEMIRRICSNSADESMTAQKANARPLDSGGGRLSTALVVHSTRAAGDAHLQKRSQECEMGA